MPKILRLGFAMGGGVSLGTFCGTALSQALKLLIVYGRDRDGRPFDKVEVDVFSGASAGALSLAAMLRSLAAPSATDLPALHADLDNEFPDALDELAKDYPEKLPDLYAAELMQRFQKQLWSEEIKLEELLDEAGRGDLPHKPSLLDRGAVDDIARRFIVEGDHSGGFPQRRLLADRVLFASTLTNLTPIIWDASASFPGKSVGYVGLNDGLRTSTHRDLRVFDLNFTVVPNPGDPIYADRWCLYHLGAEQPGMIRSLTSRAAWARIAATAIASGAFPVAFEPVVLNRGAFEYGDDRWNRIMGRPKGTPISAGESHPFSYVDGGTLNNEPIREAFRLASFIDGHERARNPRARFERLVVFVDPNVAPARPSFHVAGHGAWQPLDAGKFALRDAPAVRRTPSLPRLLGHLASVIAAVSAESTGIEADKINAVRNQFAERDGIRQVLFNTLTATPRNEDLLELMSYIEGRLADADRNDTIPSGPLTLPGELERVCFEEIGSDAHSPFRPLQTKAEAFAAEMRATGNVAHKDLWLRLLAFVSVDLILRLEGKLLDASLVAIAPFRNLAAIDAGHAPEPIWLPGGALSGFAGFMSPLPDEIEHAAAKYCAAEFLRACELVDAATPLPDPRTFVLEGPARAKFEEAFARHIERGLDKIARRLGAMVSDAYLTSLPPGVEGIVTSLVNTLIRSKIKGIEWRTEQEQACTFRVRVVNSNFELDGDSARDLDARPVKNPATGEWELITVGTWNWKSESWHGAFVKRDQLDIDVHGHGFESDEDFCDLRLPDAAMMRDAAFLPNPTFYVDLEKVDRTVNPISARAWTPEPGVVSLEDQLSPGAAHHAAVLKELVKTVAAHAAVAAPTN